jgi:ATP-binding cassette, subfamily C, bacterial CydD
MISVLHKYLEGLQVGRSAALGVTITATYVAQSVALASAIEAAINHTGAAGVVAWIGCGGAAAISRSGLIMWSGRASEKTAQKVRTQLRERLLGKLFKLGPAYTMSRSTGELQSAIVGGVEALEVYYSTYLPAVLVSIFGCSGILAYLAVIDLRSAALLAAFVVALPIVDRLWLRWRMPISSSVFAALGSFGGFLFDSLQGVSTLKALNASRARREHLSQHAARLRKESMATLSVTLARTSLTTLISLGGFAVLTIYAVWRFNSHSIGLIGLLTTLFLSREAFRPLERLEKALHAAWSASGAAQPILELFLADPVVGEPELPRQVPRQFDVVFDNVSFTYEGASKPVLERVSFHVPKGALTVIVGPSGSGKSTVISLLLRFFEQQQGNISIGGINIASLSLSDLRSLISLVSQDPLLFDGSISDNLRLAKPDATAEEMRAAARAADAEVFIDGLPNGFATEVGERGAQLSGGQRQRIAIARAILKDAPILLLDELTSNLDLDSERRVLQTLARYASHKTILAVAHRTQAIRHADKIVVLECGSVTEAGSHDELSRLNGLYSKLCHAGEALI